MYDLIAIGECLIDFTPAGVNNQGIQLFGENPGGAPANVLAMYTRLGGKTGFIGRVGDDGFGKYLAKVMQNAHIDIRGMQVDKEIPTTLAFVQLDEKGDRSFSFYRKPGADIRLTKNEIPADLIDHTAIFHFGSVSLTDEPSRSTTLDTVSAARKNGSIISFDPNYRPLLWKSESKARETILSCLDKVHILKVSDEEMTLLTGETNVEKGASMLRTMGPILVVVTMGEKGAYFDAPAGTGMVPGFAVNSIDTTGAGDSFWGTLLNELMKKHSQDMNVKAIETTTADEWISMVRYANAAAALTTTKNGAIPSMPTVSEIQSILNHSLKA
jgi:fructokinase